MTENRKQRAYSLYFSLISLGCILAIFILAMLFKAELSSSFLLPLFLYIGAGCGILTPIVFIRDIDCLLSHKSKSRPAWWKVLLAVPIWIVAFLIFLGPLGSFIYDMGFPRAPIGHARANLRNLSMAIESYRIDNKTCPAWSLNSAENAFGKRAAKAPELSRIPTFKLLNTPALGTLTTPIAYLTDYEADPFAPIKNATFAYWNNATTQTRATRFIVWSPGPDRAYDLTIDNIADACNSNTTAPTALLSDHTYDPTNGATSGGDIWRSE